MDIGTQKITIATAIEVSSTTAPLSSCFAKAKYYAFFDGNCIYIESNPYNQGIEVQQWLIEKDVTHLLLKEKNKIPCALKNCDSITLLYPTKDSNIRVDEMVRLYFKHL